LQIFGSIAYAYILDEKRKKLESKAKPWILVGYGDPLGIKGYHLYEPSTRQLFTSHDVIFYEESLLTREASLSSTQSSPLDPSNFYQVMDSFEVTFQT